MHYSDPNVQKSIYQLLSKCATNWPELCIMCSKCVRNLLQMCSKCVPNVLQVCALQFGMKVIWCVDQRPPICRIGQFHMIVMRIITYCDLMMMIAKQKDEHLILLARLVLGHKIEMAATNLCYMQLQLLIKTFLTFAS